MKCRVKFYSQEIVFFREDLLYRMRRSCLMPPSTEETNDSFEHVIFSSPLSFYIFFQINDHWHFAPDLMKLTGFKVTIAARCYHNPSESPLPPSSFCATYHLELWSLPLSLSQPTHGSILISHYCSLSCFDSRWDDTIPSFDVSIKIFIALLIIIPFCLPCTDSFRWQK